MTSIETLTRLDLVRDHGIAICRTFLAKRDLNLLDDPGAIWSRCLAEAEGNNPEAQFVVATLLLTGVLGSQDEETGAKWCRKAADVQYLPAMTTLGNLSISGAVGIPKNPSLGLDVLQRAAEGNYPPAAIYLAQAYLHGLYVSQDRTKGLSLLRQVAEIGDVLGQFHLGSELVESQERNMKSEGIAWLQSAANQGLHSAHYALALIYRVGEAGIPPNQQLAEHHQSLGQKLEEEWYRHVGASR